MKNDRIVRAYDSVNPTAVQKERILKEILAEARLDAPEGNQRRRVRPEMHGKRKSPGRRLLPLAACFAVLLAVGLVLRGHFLSSAQDAPPGPVPEKPTAVHSGYEMTAADHYAPVLEKYRRAVEESWTEEQCRIEGITPNMQYVSSKTGYALVDLDGDGREELIIAQEVSPEHDMVWDFYTTLEDGTPIQLWSDERSFDHCRVYRDNIICISHEEDQPGEHAFYVLEYGKLVLLESIEYEGDGIIHRNAEGDTRSISAQEAMELVFGYKHQKLNLTWLVEDPDGVREPDAAERYAQVIEKYQTALQEKWDREICINNDISLMIANYRETPESICAFYLDLDEDGVAELMITDGMMILDLYTLKDHKPVHLLTGWERNSYRYCMDNVIFNHGASSAYSSCYNYYRMENGALILVDSVVFDASIDPDNPWFLSADGETAGDPITEEKANEIMEQYKDMTILGQPLLQ